MISVVGNVRSLYLQTLEDVLWHTYCMQNCKELADSACSVNSYTLCKDQVLVLLIGILCFVLIHVLFQVIYLNKM